MAPTRPRHLIIFAFWVAAVIFGGPEATAAPLGPGGDPSHEVLVLLRLPNEHYRPDADYGDSYSDVAMRAARRRIAAGLAHQHGLTLVGDWPMPLVGVDCFIMSVPAGLSPETEAARLSRDPAVSWAEPVRLYQGESATGPPEDPLFPAQPAAHEWRLKDLHQLATGRKVTVAIIDSMVERNHPDLLGQVSLAEDFSPRRPALGEDHGTGIAGIIAARADNGVGIVGIAPNSHIMALRACWQVFDVRPATKSTLCDSLSLAQALHFAIENKAQIINLSLGGPPDPLLAKLLDVALARRIVVVAAYDRRLQGGGFPASHAGIIAVVDEPMTRSLSGVYSAPGRDVPTTQPGGRWFLVNGSSYAAAHVSGLFALMKERARSPAPLKLAVMAGGQGLIDTCASLLSLVGPCDCACARPASEAGISASAAVHP